jgi:general stress protein YciG
MNADEDASGASSPSEPSSPTRRRPRGFAAMDPNLVRELARRGGIAVHVAGTAHEFTPEEARVAGRLGGLASTKNRAKKADAT